MKFYLIKVLSLVICMLSQTSRAEIDAMTGEECVDNNEQCPYWASIGECVKNKSYMGVHCRKSCDRCKVVRVNSANDINSFLASKKREIDEKAQAVKALKALKGGQNNKNEPKEEL